MVKIGLQIAPNLRETEYEIALASIPSLIGPREINPTFVSTIIPSDRIMQIRKAKEYRKIDIIDRIIRIKRDFGINIKGIKISNKFKRQKEEQQKFYDEKVFPLIERITEQWEKEHSTIGDVFLHYAFQSDEKTPMFLTIEDPERVRVIQALGTEMYEVQLSNKLRENLKKLKEKGQIDVLPRYLREYINERKQGDRLILTSENMYRTTNMKSDYEEYSDIPLMTIAEAIELRRALTDVDFTSAYSAAKEIVHTKVGTKEKPADKDRIKKLHDSLTHMPPGVYYLTTRHDVELVRIKPNIEIFDAKKYQECNARILQWSGVTVNFLNGESGAYAGALVSIKGFQQSIQSDRKVFNRFIKHFFDDINRRNGFRGTAELIYDRDSLTGSADFLNEIKYLVSMGIYGIEDLCILFDLDLEEQIEKKKREKEFRDDFKPWFEPNQGLLENNNGRPKTNENNVRETNQPKPSNND